MEDIKITSMENHHEMTRELWTKTIFSKVRKDEQALIVVGLHGGVAPGPIVRNVNTVAVGAVGLGTLDGSPLVVTLPDEPAELLLGALRGQS